MKGKGNKKRGGMPVMGVDLAPFFICFICLCLENIRCSIIPSLGFWNHLLQDDSGLIFIARVVGDRNFFYYHRKLFVVVTFRFYLLLYFVCPLSTVGFGRIYCS